MVQQGCVKSEDRQKMEMKAKGLSSDISRNVHRLGATAEEFSPDHSEENSSNVQISPSTKEDILGGPRQRRKIIAFTVMALIVAFILELVFNFSGWIRFVELVNESGNGSGDKAGCECCLGENKGTSEKVTPRIQYYLIVSQMHGMLLDVDRGQKQPGAFVFPFHRNGDLNQQWYDDPETGLIRSRLNDFCLDFEHDRLVLNPCQPGKHEQQWVRRGRTIANRMKNNVVLDILEKQKSAGAKIGSYSENGGSNQQWTFELV